MIPELFELGLMGIHIPEEFGGSSGSFFMSVLAVEEISRVDASFGVFIDVQNTLVNNAIMRWANEATEDGNTCRDWRKIGRGVCIIRGGVRQRCVCAGLPRRGQRGSFRS